MGTSIQSSESKKSISCRIVHKESGIGIPDLQLAFFSAPTPAAQTRNASSRTSRTNETTSNILTVLKSAERLGSVLTDSEGKGVFYWNPTVFDTAAIHNLLLVVLIPDEPGLALKDRILHHSSDIGFFSGGDEVTLIKIKGDLLKSKNIGIPSVSSQDDRLSKLAEEIDSNAKFVEKKKQLFKEKIVDAKTSYNKTRRENFTIPFIDAISTVPANIRDNSTFVKPGVNISDFNARHIRDLLGTSFPTPGKNPVKGYIYLTKQEKQQFQTHIDASGEYYLLPDSVIKEVILPKIFNSGESGSQNDYVALHPLSRTKSVSGGETENPEDSGTIPPAVRGTSIEDIPTYIARQMDNQGDGAIETTNLSLETRPTQTDIDNAIAAMAFQKGPADVPAYYEFHSIKVAFENIWQETFDLGLIEKAEKWYDQVVANGTEPDSFMPFFLSLIGDAAGALSGMVNHGIEWLGDRFGGGGSSGSHGSGPVVVDHRLTLTNEVTLEFPEAIGIWDYLTKNEKTVLLRVAELLTEPFAGYFTDGRESGERPNWRDTFERDKREMFAILRTKGKNLIDIAQERVNENKALANEFTSLARANELTTELKNSLTKPYAFKHYAANSRERSVNFGILLSYQQKWEPLNYQAGELVKTIPLAPKEIRRFSKKTTIKKSRIQKEMEENLRISRSENQDTSRAEAEIVNKALNKSTIDNVNTVSGDVSLGPLNGSGSTSLTLHTEAQRESQQTKKDFREAVLKSAQEYKNERKIEITTEDSYESEVNESGEIINPNDELTVTYLFYELQRRFKISERLYRLRPVIMVAQELPAPHEIDNEWIITHDWMLKRCLLDDSFRAGMDFIYTVNGDLLMIDEFKKTVTEQRKIVKDLRQSVRFLTQEVATQNALMMRAIDRQANIIEDSDIWDGIPILGKTWDVSERALSGIGNLLGMGEGDDPAEAARMRTEAATAVYERVERERRELLAKLENETANLNSMSQQLALKQKERIEKSIHIERLKVHIKDNILYYMQSIWTHEHKDKRFFRLLDTKVPKFHGSYSIRIKVDAEKPTIGSIGLADKTRHSYWLNPDIEVDEVTLKEVADLDNLLGYKGNYMIFPLTKSNILTDYMMAPYIDSEFGLTDPDELSNWSLEDFEAYVAKLRAERGEQFAEIEEELKRMYKELLQDPLRNGDTITVPTGSLFIEALPGSHTILEYFKLAHRYEDVKKAQAENRWSELNNTRLAARIITGDYDEAKADKRIVMEGPINPMLDVDS